MREMDFGNKTNWENHYDKDGRLHLGELYHSFERLVVEGGWEKSLICYQTPVDNKGQPILNPLTQEVVKFPIYGYSSPIPEGVDTVDSLYEITGTHGEESAGPIAEAEETDTLLQLPKEGIAVVMIGVMNPVGYVSNRRYFNRFRSVEKGKSVGDFEHAIPHPMYPERPMRKKPSNIYAAYVSEWLYEKVGRYKPILVKNSHEDELKIWGKVFGDSFVSYLYANGNDEILEVVEPHMLDILGSHGFSFAANFQTRFKGQVTNERGVVRNAKDGSIDQWFVQDKHYLRDEKRFVDKTPAVATVTVETAFTDDTSLEKRVETHRDIIRNEADLFWKIKASK